MTFRPLGRICTIFFAAAATVVSAEAPDVILGSAPIIENPPEASAADSIARDGGISVDNQNRAAVIQFYYTYYVGTADVPANWTGSVASCDPGTVDAAYQDATMKRINYYRAMVGLPGNVTLRSDLSSKADDMAVMISANENEPLNHAPPTSWTCWTQDGYDAAQRSNLVRGADGVAAIDGYMEDHGAGNTYVGHRRWTLYPRSLTMGVGDAPTGTISPPRAGCLWVIVPEDFGSRPASPEWVSWPPPGYVPYQVINAKNGSTSRWSFSMYSADFTNAGVMMDREGTNVPVTVQPIYPEFGSSTIVGDNTIVWEFSETDFTTSTDVEYNIHITNVVDQYGATRNFNYTVTIIDASGTPPGAPSGWMGH
ncbi:CAP domain-containing protein [bacterium]|nr:CAP domain-containing protein [bacterium]